jgi:glycosyltransferase involved in cell wall biosynthesis
VKQIVFVNRFFFPDHSATSQLLGDLAFELARGGMRVLVVTSQLRYDDPSADLPASESIDGVSVRRVWTTRFGRQSLSGRAVDYLSFYTSGALALLSLVRKGDVVVAKTDPPLISIVAAVCARLKGATLVNWLQDVFPEVAEASRMRVAGGASGRLLRALRDASLRAATVNVAIGWAMKARIANCLPDDASVVVIPNWSDGRSIVPVDKVHNPLTLQWGFADKFVVGYSGNMGRTHELESLLDAAEQLRSDPRIVFLLIGDGSQKAAIAERVRERSLTNVVLKPYQPRSVLPLSLGVIDLHVVSLLPAFEGLIVPSKFTGVTAAGRPVLFIGSESGEIGRIISESGCGVVVARGAADELVSKILHLVDSPLLMERMRRAARRVFDESYDKGTAVQRWTSVLCGIEARAAETSDCPRPVETLNSTESADIYPRR